MYLQIIIHKIILSNCTTNNNTLYNQKKIINLKATENNFLTTRKSQK
jgi:hypothetical protein